MLIAALGLLAQSAIATVDPDQLGANPGVPSTLCIIQEKPGGADERWHWTPLVPLPPGVAPSSIERALEDWVRGQGITPYAVTCLNDSRGNLERRFGEALPRTTEAIGADGTVMYLVQHQAIALPTGWAEGRPLSRRQAPQQAIAAPTSPGRTDAPARPGTTAPAKPSIAELNARDQAEFEAKMAAWEAEQRRYAEEVRANEERAERDRAAYEAKMADWRASVAAAKAEADRKKAEFDRKVAELQATTFDCGRGDGSRCRRATASEPAD